jgi:hypothetical protein
MIIVKFKGGLGNQMFQYATARALSLKYGQPLFFDLSWYGQQAERETQRHFTLGQYRIMGAAAEPADCQRLKPGACQNLWKRLMVGLDRGWHYRFRPSVLKPRPDYYLEDACQSYKYFSDQADVLRQEFALRDDWSEEGRVMSEQIAAVPQAVGLHIRRGDYVADQLTSWYHGSCSLEYYQKAIGIMRERFGAVTLFIFSDDIAWAEQNLKSEVPMVFVSRPGIPDYEELLLMSHCQHQIIANSSFSWWAAWLNSYPGKVVVAPAQWLKAVKIKTGDLLPPEWIKL